MLSYVFIQHALIVGIIVSLCAALLGVSLVLRRHSMIGDGLSHVAFGAFAIATVLGLAPLEFAIPISILVSFAILRLHNASSIHGDAAIALVSASALAIGILVISATQGVNVDINAFLFGSILAIGTSEVVISIILGLAILSFFIVFYHRIFAITFDETFAKSIGLKVNLYQAVLATLCSVTIVLGMKLLGALLISSLVIFPCLTAMQFTRNFRTTTIAAAIISVICFIVGLVVSYYYSLPTGASIVVINLICFLVFFILRRFIK